MNFNTIKKLIDDSVFNLIIIDGVEIKYYFKILLPHLYQNSNSFISYGYVTLLENIIIKGYKK